MAIVAVNNLQNHRLIISVSWRQALTRIVIGNSLQIVDCCGWVLSWVWRAPSPCLFLLGIVGLSLKGFMLAIDIASTYGHFFAVQGINDPWWNLLQGLSACDAWSLICWFSQESPVFIIKTYPYDTYHDCDITLVTLGSVLAHISMEKRSCFHGQGGS